MTALDDLLTACGCCAGIESSTPIGRDPRPGLSSLPWRVGTHGRFLASMLAEIAGQPSLGRLGTRRADDLTIGVVDAWAITLDVLAFYQERLANEAFLRTAEERRSLLELARLIGYELKPGVSAEVLLAFILDDAKTSPKEVTIEPGTRAQSLPVEKDELPQSFETGDELFARPRWNSLHPRRTAPQEIDAESRVFYFSGLATNLRRGDPLLLVTGTGAGEQTLLEVVSVEPQAEEGRTLVSCDAVEPPFFSTDPGLVFGNFGFETNFTSFFSGGPVAGGELMVQTEEQGWTTENLIANIGALWRQPADFTPADPIPAVYALRVTSAAFGHNAPRRSTLPWRWRIGANKVFPGDWDQDGGWPIDQSAVTNAGKGAIHLEQAFDEVLEGTWVVLEGKSGVTGVYRARSVAQESLADFSLSAKTTRIELEAADRGNVDHGTVGASFKLRDTAIHTASERLELIELPIEELPAGTSDLLLEEIVPDLEPGRRLILKGERYDEPGVVATEELTLERLEQGSHTQLFFEEGLEHSYQNQKVEILANVVNASHGETKAEILGSGDAGLPYQRFLLRQNPLTYTSAPVPSGGVANLELRLDGVRWHEAPSLYGLGPKDRAYVLRRGDDGKTAIVFGDGERGQRPPTGAENLAVEYRVGVGTPGLVGPERITLLATKPLGVKEVNNPIASAGAEDPETREQARRNAPLTVLTLDRAVSLRDFEDFARAFSGIAKARADRVWDGSRRVIHLTLAGSGGEVPSEKVRNNLRASLDAARDPYQPLKLADFDVLRFGVAAKLKIAPDHEWEVVAAAARAALEMAFSFDARELGRRLAASEVWAVLQAVPGVVAVDLDELFEVGGNLEQDDFGLSALPARFVESEGEIRPAQLLVLADASADPIQLSQMP